MLLFPMVIPSRKFISTKLNTTQRMIHQIFSLMRNWSKRVMWLNIPQLKLGNIAAIFPIFKTAHVTRKICKIINTMASIWHENMLGYLCLDMICSSKLTVCSRKTVHFSEQIMSMDKFIPEHIFTPNGSHCLFNSVTLARASSLIWSPMN